MVRTLFDKPKVAKTKKVNSKKPSNKKLSGDYNLQRGNENKPPVYYEIKQLRLQMLIHSCIYYHLNDNIISDIEFDKRARKLAALQKQYPQISESVIWAEEFRNWDGTTGYDLPLRDPWVLNKAQQILEIHKRYVGGKLNEK